MCVWEIIQEKRERALLQKIALNAKYFLFFIYKSESWGSLYIDFVTFWLPACTTKCKPSGHADVSNHVFSSFYGSNFSCSFEGLFKLPIDLILVALERDGCLISISLKF